MITDKFKLNFNFYTNLLFLFVLLFGGFIWADTNGIWTKAEDVRPGIFGGDEGLGNFIFNNYLELNKNTTYKGEELDERFVNSNGGDEKINGSLFITENLHSDKVYSNDYFLNNQNLDDRYAFKNETYKKNEVYNKSEIDAIIANLNLNPGNSGSGNLDLVYGLHSSSQCENLGGVIMNDLNNNKFCKFVSSSCPAGWSQYQNWQNSVSKTCNGLQKSVPRPVYSDWQCPDGFSGTIICTGATSCTTISKSFNNSALTNCSYVNEKVILTIPGLQCNPIQTCSTENVVCISDRSEIGCY